MEKLLRSNGRNLTKHRHIWYLAFQTHAASQCYLLQFSTMLVYKTLKNKYIIKKRRRQHDVNFNRQQVSQRVEVYYGKHAMQRSKLPIQNTRRSYLNRS